MDLEQEIDFVQLKDKIERDLAQRERKARQEKVKSATIALAISSIGAFTAAFSFLKLDRPKEITIAASTIQYDQIRSELNALRAQIVARPPNSPALESTAAIALDKRLTALESAIMERPDKALAIPLLRKELDDLSRRETEARAASRMEIDRLYEQQKWILGGIGTVLLAIAGGAISILLKSSFKAKVGGEE
jgi:hypothetical protein